MKGMKLKVGVLKWYGTISYYYDSEQKKITGFDIDLLINLWISGLWIWIISNEYEEIRAKRSNKELDLAIAEFQSWMKDRERVFIYRYLL